MSDNKQVYFDEKVGPFHVTVIRLASDVVKIQTFNVGKGKLLSELSVVPSSHDLSIAEAASSQLLKPVDIETIFIVVANHYELLVSAIRGKRRQPRIAEARHVAMWLAKQLTPMTLKELAKEFSKGHHTTIVHAAKRVANQMEKDKDFAYRVNFMRDKIKKESSNG